MSYSFGSFPATGVSSFPNFGATYGGFSGLTSGYNAGGLTSFAQPTQFSSGFASSFPSTGFGAVAPTVFGNAFGSATPAFGASTAAFGNTFGGLNNYAAFSAAPTVSNGFNGFNSAYNTAPVSAYPSGFGSVVNPAFGSVINPNFPTPAAVQQQALAAQQGDARPRAVSNIEYGFGVPTLVPKTKDEEALQRTPSGNLPRRQASGKELSTRRLSHQPQSGSFGPHNSMAAYLASNCSLDARTAQAIGGSTLAPRNLGAPTGHRGSNPREQVPW